MGPLKVVKEWIKAGLQRRRRRFIHQREIEVRPKFPRAGFVISLISATTNSNFILLLLLGKNDVVVRA
jgi:hypothetical protein